jgi:aryl-alcohol dehydrogenase-like predicted oxidoreductase
MDFSRCRRVWNAFGGITTILEDGDLLIGGAFGVKRVIAEWREPKRNFWVSHQFYHPSYRFRNSAGVRPARATLFCEGSRVPGGAKSWRSLRSCKATALALRDRLNMGETIGRAQRQPSNCARLTGRNIRLMNYRKLGKTGLTVSEVGYGAWGIGKSGWIGASDDESLKALHKSIDLGLNFIDTALAYGNGHSEKLVGRVAKERSETIYVATKIPPKNGQWPAQSAVSVAKTFPAGHVIACTEESLKNLGLEAIDVQQFHVWSDEWANQGDWLEAIQKLKQQGKLKNFGVSINDYQPENAIKLIETGVVDTIQVIYNIFEQRPEDQLFPACERHKVGIIVRVALDEGGLTGQITPDTIFEPSDFRSNFFRGDRKQQVYERVQKIASDLNITLGQMAETALRYVLSHTAVSTVIPGMRSVRNVERNCHLGDGRGLPREQVEKLKAHRWARNFYG